MPIPSQYKEIIRNSVGLATATGLMIGPGTDIPFLIAIWAGGAASIAEKFGFRAGPDAFKALVTSVLAGSAQWIVAGITLDVLTAWIPGVNVAVNGFVNAFFTYRFLRAIANICNDSGSIDEVLADSMLTVLINQLGNLSPGTLIDDAREVMDLID